jgi:hypothetical protein
MVFMVEIVFVVIYFIWTFLMVHAQLLVDSPKEALKIEPSRR